MRHRSEWPGTPICVKQTIREVSPQGRDANFAKEAARFHKWPDRIWSRRYRAIPIVDDHAAPARMQYMASHGAREGLVAGARSWPGINCIAALTHGDRLKGTLTPLPCLRHMKADERQTHYRKIVRDIDKEAKETNERLGRKPVGVQAILAARGESLRVAVRADFGPAAAS